MAATARRPDVQLAHDIDLELAIGQAIGDHPEWERYLQEMVAWEEKHPVRPDDVYSGFEWHTVHTPAGALNAMVILQIVDVRSKSRTYTNYRLHNVAATKGALENAGVSMATDEPLQLDNLFETVFGQDQSKKLLLLALQSEKPIHCLLLGEVGTAKTMLLSDIARLPGAVMYSGGGGLTKAGLLGLLLQERPRILVLDEADKCKAHDLDVLLGLMESGRVTRLHHNNRDQVDLDTKVFAGANDTKTLSGPLLSRFAKFPFPPYTAAEFVQVACKVLETREGVGPAVAQLIAHEVGRYSHDVRDAVRIARLAAGQPGLVQEIVSHLLRPQIKAVR